jgi:hypothetical protein
VWSCVFAGCFFGLVVAYEACVESVSDRRLLLVDGCWSRAQRSLLSARTEGESLQLLKLRPTTMPRYCERDPNIPPQSASCIYRAFWMIDGTRHLIRDHSQNNGNTQFPCAGHFAATDTQATGQQIRNQSKELGGRTSWNGA